MRRGNAPPRRMRRGAARNLQWQTMMIMSFICSCRNKIGAEFRIYLEEVLFRGPSTNDIVLHPRGHGSARTCSSTCKLSPAGSLHSSRRNPLWDKIREVGRGLSLADTRTGRYVRLYSRRRLCARRDADALGRRSSDPSLDFQQLLRLLLFRAMRPKDIPVSVLC